MSEKSNNILPFRKKENILQNIESTMTPEKSPNSSKGNNVISLEEGKEIQLENYREKIEKMLTELQGFHAEAVEKYAIAQEKYKINQTIDNQERTNKLLGILIDIEAEIEKVESVLERTAQEIQDLIEISLKKLGKEMGMTSDGE